MIVFNTKTGTSIEAEPEELHFIVGGRRFTMADARQMLSAWTGVLVRTGRRTKAALEAIPPEAAPSSREPDRST